MDEPCCEYERKAQERRALVRSHATFLDLQAAAQQFVVRPVQARKPRVKALLDPAESAIRRASLRAIRLPAGYYRDEQDLPSVRATTMSDRSASGSERSTVQKRPQSLSSAWCDALIEIAGSGTITDELDATIVKVGTALADELQVHPSQLGNMPADWDMKAAIEQCLAEVLDKSAQRLLFVGYVGQIQGGKGKKKNKAACNRKKTDQENKLDAALRGVHRQLECADVGNPERFLTQYPTYDLEANAKKIIAQFPDMELDLEEIKGALLTRWKDQHERSEAARKNTLTRQQVYAEKQKQLQRSRAALPDSAAASIKVKQEPGLEDASGSQGASAANVVNAHHNAGAGPSISGWSNIPDGLDHKAYLAEAIKAEAMKAAPKRGGGRKPAKPTSVQVLLVNSAPGPDSSLATVVGAGTVNLADLQKQVDCELMGLDSVVTVEFTHVLRAKGVAACGDLERKPSWFVSTGGLPEQVPVILREVCTKDKGGPIIWPVVGIVMHDPLMDTPASDFVAFMNPVSA